MIGADEIDEAQRLQQMVVNHDGEAFVEACPGAGKTRTLVERVDRVSKGLAPRKGLAVLSFTNSAVEEFKERCRKNEMSGRLGFPSFVGTFDSFLNHFLVLPFGISGCPSRPIIVDSWSEIQITPGIRGGQTPPIQLSRFDAATGQIDRSLIRDRRIVANLIQHQPAYEAAAKRRRKALNANGLLAADDARLVAKTFLSDPKRADALGKAMAARFQEVIVDEAQDCNADDVEVLEWLRRHGIPLILVCDPDQAIYGFRKGTNQAFTTFVAGFPKLPMNGNFRSSEIICGASASMRRRVSADRAVGDDRNSPFVVQIMPYSKKANDEIGLRFLAIASGKNLADCIVLAHKRSLAEQASGNPPQSLRLGGRLARLAKSVIAFHLPSSTGRQRDVAMKAMIHLMMEIEGKDDDEIVSLRALSNSPETNREYRRKAIDILTALPPSCDTSEADKWMAHARAIVGKIVVPGGGKSIKQALPAGNDWEEQLVSLRQTASARCATIHEAKGRDYDGVCLVLDKDSEQAITDWESRASDTSEALRVLYVGVTRAKKLLVIALPTALLARVKLIFKASNVVFNEEKDLKKPQERKKYRSKTEAAQLS